MERAIVLTVTCTAAAALAAAYLHFARKKGLDHYVRREVGGDAVHCGSFGLELSPADATLASSCMTHAHLAGEPFFFQTQGPGLDSTIGEAIVGRSGRLTRLFYDSAPCGGPGCAERIIRTPCPVPPGNPIRPDLACP